MKSIYKILITPEIKSAYFSEYIQVAIEEARVCLPDISVEHIKSGPLDFLQIECDKNDLDHICQLSSFQGIFLLRADNTMSPLGNEPQYFLSEKFVFGSKFKGKTNERLTQMLINISLAHAENKSSPKILDPMCGRGTTLMWAMRLGLDSKGIEVDPKAPEDIMQIAKKWNTVEQANLKFSKGFVGKKNKQSEGKFLEIMSAHAKTKIITGNASNTSQLLSDEKFDCIISDIPYGVAHKSAKGSRNPLDEIVSCIDGWKFSLKPGGVVTIAFNSYIPTKKDLTEAFISRGLTPLEMNLSHRMSESIVRDVVCFKL
jgi:hypothetical protein